MSTHDTTTHTPATEGPRPVAPPICPALTLDGDPATADLHLTHTAATGTILHGTTQGDGTATVLKAHRWKWGRSISAWYVPHSRDKLPARRTITRTTRALREAGHTVAVTLDRTLRDPETVETELLARRGKRAEGLDAKAARAAEHAATAERRRVATFDALPADGQPILVGHHSERRHRRALDAAHTAMGKAVEADDAARARAESASIAHQRVTHRYSRSYVANRAAEWRAQARKMARVLAGTQSGYRVPVPGSIWHGDLTEQEAHARAQVVFWETKLSELEPASENRWKPENMQVNGQILPVGGGNWLSIQRVNRVSVTTHGGSRWPLEMVGDYRPPAQ